MKASVYFFFFRRRRRKKMNASKEEEEKNKSATIFFFFFKKNSSLRLPARNSALEPPALRACALLHAKVCTCVWSNGKKSKNAPWRQQQIVADEKGRACCCCCCCCGSSGGCCRAPSAQSDRRASPVPASPALADPVCGPFDVAGAQQGAQSSHDGRQDGLLGRASAAELEATAAAAAAPFVAFVDDAQCFRPAASSSCRRRPSRVRNSAREHGALSTRAVGFSKK